MVGFHGSVQGKETYFLNKKRLSIGTALEGSGILEVP